MTITTKLTKIESAKLKRIHVYPRTSASELNELKELYPEVNIVTAMKHFTYQRRHAEVIRDIPFELTFEQWLQLWLDSGKWEERGRGGDKYCMCRIGDNGPYAVDNVFIATNSQNTSDGFTIRRGAKQ